MHAYRLQPNAAYGLQPNATYGLQPEANAITQTHIAEACESKMNGMTMKTAWYKNSVEKGQVLHNKNENQWSNLAGVQESESTTPLIILAGSPEDSDI